MANDHSAIYLDYAAATPIDPVVLAAMQPYYLERFHNPSAVYLAGKAVNADLQAARKSIAHWLGARPSEIIFTAGGTEANNLAIHGIMQQFPNANVVISGIEHDAVYIPAGQYDRRLAAVDKDGNIDLDALRASIDDRTVLVSVMYANNEIGTVLGIKEIAVIIQELRKNRIKLGNTTPLLLHTDACQAANYLTLNVHQLGVDLMTLNGGKIYGPKQSGCLYVRAGLTLSPLILGGGQESNLRSGTEAVPSVMGFASALEQAQTMRQAESQRLTQLRDHFIADLERAIPAIVLNGSRKHRLPNNVHVTIPGTDNERLMMALDEQGIQCATGSACSASKAEPSRTLAALGLDIAEIQASLRFTMGRGTTSEQLSRVVSALASLAT